MHILRQRFLRRKTMISKFSVKKPYTVLVGVILVIVLGVVSFMKTTTDLFPNITLPYVLVMTTYPGASPETVEMAVTSPVESAMATVSNIESISSVSNENYSMVILEFSQSADMNAISLEIRENLDQIKSYWDDSVGNPIIIKMNPDMLPVMIAAVGVDGMDNAQVSDFAQESIVPELESVEGIASVSAVGLLEESVNVIIRAEKIDEVNEKIFAAIDKKMQEAADEIADGKKALQENKEKLEQSAVDIAKGQKELADGQKLLEDGEAELKKKREETAQTLANTKKDLLTAKADLEATKMNMTTNLTTAKTMSDSIGEIDFLLGAGESYQGLLGELTAAQMAGDEAGAAKVKERIGAVKKKYVESTMLNTAAAGNEMLGGMLKSLKDMDWSDPASAPMIGMMLGGVSQGAAPMMQEQKEKMEAALNSMTSGMGYAGYEKIAETTMETINDSLEAVNNGLVEVEKGELTAAVEFANAYADIVLNKYKMEVAKGQLDTAAEQIKSGREQLEDGEEKLADGEKQFEEGKVTAREKADMNGILTVDTVKGLLTAQNFSMPAGYVTEEGNEFLIRVGDKPKDLEDLKSLPLMNLHMEDVPVITLGDVADVFFTDNSGEFYTNVNGSAGVMLTMQKQTGYSTGEVSDRLAERFERLMDRHEGLTIITLMDQGIYIDLVMKSIFNNILFGAGLAILILILFLKDLRPTFVIACSIPVSLVAAIVCMYFSGVTLNVISLSGLALGIGMLVDNSIVVIENIYRLRGEGYSVKEAAVEGAREVAGAIVASTLTTICVFLPIVFTEGITRQLFVDMGLTIAYSLVASLAIALTVVPALSSKVLVKGGMAKEGKFFGVLIKGYEAVLRGALKAKALVLIGVFVLLGFSVWAALRNGTAFMAQMDSTQLTVNVRLDKEATLEDTAEVTDELVSRLLEMEDIENVGAMTSASTMSLLGGGRGSTNSASVYVVTREDKTLRNEEIGKQILENTADLNAEISVDTSSMDMSALGGSGISIQVRGRDLDTLRSIAVDVASIIEGVEGTANVSDGLGNSSEELRVIVDRDKAIDYGLTVAQVFAQIAGKLADAGTATVLAAPEKDYNVYVMSGTDIELTRALLEEIEISGTDENQESVKIPLSDIAEFETAMSLNSIRRSEHTRYISVSAGIAEGYNVGLVATAVERELSKYEIPEGYRLVYSGENETINDAMRQVLLMLVLALVFMYLIMVAQFQSLLSPFIIMFTIPLAFTGGFLGLFVTGSEVSVIAMIGFVMLSGVIVNNGIVLIDYMNQLREAGMDRKEAIITAGRTRLRPVLMTALTTILALSTMVFSNDMGADMAKPMAIVTIGGLLYGTLLTLVVIPCIYDSLARLGRKKETVSEE